MLEEVGSKALNLGSPVVSSITAAALVIYVVQFHGLLIHSVAVNICSC
jgi:hypothetical protein